MDEQTALIKENLSQVRMRIARAAQAVGRDASGVQLVVVTKAQPVEVVQAAIAAGATLLGENYPEETVEKIAVLGRPPGGWHMIGHLQSRKANLVVEHFDMLHSLDSVRLAQKLEQRLAERGRMLPVLLEVNVGGEESKYGWRAAGEYDWLEILPDIEAILQLPHLDVRGLMTMPPYRENPEESRVYFTRLRKMNEKLAARYPEAHFTELSMGTSVDFEVAVQEGATFVRIGELILGPRLKRQY